MKVWQVVLSAVFAVTLTLAGAPADAKRPTTAAIISNNFAGKVKLTAAEWAAQRSRLAPFGAMLG